MKRRHVLSLIALAVGPAMLFAPGAQAAGESSDSIVKKLLEDVLVGKGAANASVADVLRS